jgi:translation elongation factor EF-1alpha
MVLPQGNSAEVKDAWIQEEKTERIEPGNYGSVLLRNIDKDSLEEGIVLTHEQSDYRFASLIRARLLVLEGSFVPGSSLILHCGTSYTTAQISTISRILKENLKYKNIPRDFEGRVNIAFKSELIEVDLILDSVIVVEKFSDYPELGRIILRHSGRTIAVGVIHDILKQN